MDGIIVTPLKIVPHEKGNIYHGMKKDEPGFSEFGEVYFSTVNYNETKGWKLHQQMILNFIVPVGEIKVVVFNQDVKHFFEIILSEKNYQRLTILPGRWVAFKGLSEGKNLLTNVASIKHDPSESQVKALKEIVYDW